MSLNVLFSSIGRKGATVFFTVERTSDTTFFDFSDSTFKAAGSITGTNYKGTITEGASWRKASWTGSIASTPTAQFSDGRYIVRVHDDADADDAVIGAVESYFQGGDEVRTEASITDVVGTPGSGQGTLHTKLGAYTGASSSNVKDAISTLGTGMALSLSNNNVKILAVNRGVRSAIPRSFTLAIPHEHRHVIAAALVSESNETPQDISSHVLRFTVSTASGDGIVPTLDLKSSDATPRITATNATNGEFEIDLRSTQTNALTEGTDYYCEILSDFGVANEWQLLAGGTLKCVKAADVIAG